MSAYSERKFCDFDGMGRNEHDECGTFNLKDGQVC